ncbi:hypothetical protein GIB67_011954 [Kingdonia uniflora]|uniref:SET domain-containing protein n=1 Tax=Kingdonia uniflora TaxID=39325 RepID=A0A7J7LZY5_9MAGN|nr:hypothetical protein GIB67_011954 [Kingdonia uniflora]
MKEENQHVKMEEEMMNQLRSKATELLLREEWKDSIELYSHFISLSQNQLLNSTDQTQISKIKKPLCLALSNRAEALSRLKDFSEAIKDCDEALEIDSTHFKTIICKGKILLNLNRYSMALNCFKLAISDVQTNGNSEILNGYLEKCKKLEFQSRTGAFDLSDWIVNGFRDKSPELAEYLGSVKIGKSGYSGRGLFATKEIEAGTVLVVTKAVATGRGILPDSSEVSVESARLVMWKDFVDKVVEAITKCSKTRSLICTLASGECEEVLEVLDTSLFRPGTEEGLTVTEKIEMDKILDILDVNSLTEDAISAKVLGKNSDYYGVGLWVLASFINHSCNPNARRLHVGDHVIVHTSRDVKAGEEITFAYFDVLSPLKKRRELSKEWGFPCNCQRCKFEEELSCSDDLREIEVAFEFGSDMGAMIIKLEKGMRKAKMKGKEKGYLRASYWTAFLKVYKLEKLVKKWGRRIPTAEAIAESIAEAVGGDERVLKVVVQGLKKYAIGALEMEKVMKLGRGVYGKVLKKKAVRALLELSV